MEIFEDLSKVFLAVALIVLAFSLITIPTFSNYHYYAVTDLGFDESYGVSTAANAFSSASYALADNNYTLELFLKKNSSYTGTIVAIAFQFNASMFENVSYVFFEVDRSIYISKIEIELFAGSSLLEVVQTITITDNVTSFNATINEAYLRSRINANPTATHVRFVITTDITKLDTDLYTIDVTFATTDVSGYINFAVLLFVVSIIFTWVAKVLKLPDYF